MEMEMCDKALEQGVNMTSHGGDIMGGSRMARGVCPGAVNGRMELL